MSFGLKHLDVEDIERLQKQGVRAEEHYQPNMVIDEKNPLKGVITNKGLTLKKHLMS